MAVEVVLGTAVILLSVAVVYLARENEPEIDVELDQNKVRGAVTESWQNLELDEKIGSVERQVESVQDEAEKIQDLHRNIQTMLENPQERGEFGERKLEDLLSRHLPSEMFGTREAVVGMKKPDAYIESSAGRICIDSKFPLEQFRKMEEADSDEMEEKHRKKFRKAVERQLEQVSSKYVKPEKGTAEFAFEFVPSERVYHYLVREEYEMLSEFTAGGVQVASPLTLGHKLELIKSDLRLEKLTDEAEKVQENLQELETEFSQFENDWSTFYETHLSSLTKKADDLNSDFRNLRQRFDRINLED